MVKPCSLGVHPRACGRSLNGTPTTELSCRTTKTGARSSYVQDGVSPLWMSPRLSGSLSFHPELFRGKDEPRHLTTGTRTAHISAYAFIRGVGGGLGGKERERTLRRDGQGGLARYEKSRVFSERGDKGEQRVGGLRSAGEETTKARVTYARS